MTTRTKDIITSCLIVLLVAAATVGGYHLGHERTAPVPFLNSTAYASVPSWDGETLYIVGNFTRAQGIDRNRVVAIDTYTGKVVKTFSVNVNSTVETITLDHVNGYLTITGRFTTVNGVERLHTAVLRESDGALLG